MILLSSPLKNDPPETKVSIFSFLETEIVTTKIVNSKSLKKNCRQLLSTMNALKAIGNMRNRYLLRRVLYVVRAGVAKTAKIQCTIMKLLTQPAIPATCKKSISSF